MTAFSYPERGVYEHFEIQGKAYQSQRQEPCVPLLCGYAPGSMKELVRAAKGYVWICRLRDEVQAREIEKNIISHLTIIGRWCTDKIDQRKNAEYG